MEENKKVIGIAQVLQQLKDGMTRDEIGTHYGITKGECKQLFQHPALKGKKTIKKPSFVIVEDVSAIDPVVALSTVTTEKEVPEEQEDVKEEKQEGFGTVFTDEPLEEEVDNESEKATWE